MTPLALLLAAAALGQHPWTLNQVAVGGAQLERNLGYYKAVFAGPLREDRLEGGLGRLVWPREGVEVYHPWTANRATGIVTWNRRFRTGKGIGPCSTTAALRRAYGTRLAPFRLAGRVVGYRLGRLFFATESARVGAVQLSTAELPPYAALNAPECRP